MTRHRSLSPQGRSLLEVLLARRGEWLHGYELSEQTALKSGTLYPILMRLNDRRLLECRWEPSPHEGRPPRRLYRLTTLGVAYATEQSAPAAATHRTPLLGRT